MSEYEPITAELRVGASSFGSVSGTPMLEFHEGDFERLCDAIDAVHAGLERENAELRERVAVLDNRSESMHDGGCITDELRKFMDGADGYELWCPRHKNELTAIANRIDAEHENAMAAAALIAGVPMTDEHMAKHGWIRLPLDADGVPWRIGDRTESGQTVEAMGLNMHGWHFVGTVNEIDPAIHRHYRAPTVEDVLTEFGIDWEHESDCEDRAALLAEYAAKLRLAGDAS